MLWTQLNDPELPDLLNGSLSPYSDREVSESGERILSPYMTYRLPAVRTLLKCEVTNIHVVRWDNFSSSMQGNIFLRKYDTAGDAFYYPSRKKTRTIRMSLLMGHHSCNYQLGKIKKKQSYISYATQIFFNEGCAGYMPLENILTFVKACNKSSRVTF